MFEEFIFYILEFVIAIFFILRVIIRGIKKKQNNVKFNEFDNIDEIEEKQKQKARFEDELNDMRMSGTKEILRREMDKNGYINILNVDKQTERLEKFINDSKFINSVEIKNEYLDGYAASQIKESQNNIDLELFKKWCREIFEYIQIGNDEELNAIKNFMTEEMFDKITSQKERFRKDGLELKKENLSINEIKFLDYGKSLSKEEIKMYINSTMKEYLVELSTNAILAGNDKKTIVKNIAMTFQKKELELEEGLIHNCPNCNANTTQTDFGRCKYCGTVVAPIRYNWTLVNYETI